MNRTDILRKCMYEESNGSEIAGAAVAGHARTSLLWNTSSAPCCEHPTKIIRILHSTQLHQNFKLSFEFNKIPEEEISQLKCQRTYLKRMKWR